MFVSNLGLFNQGYVTSHSLKIAALHSFKFFTLQTYLVFVIFELRHEISNNVVGATNKASDQPAHKRSLIRAFASRLNIL